MGRIKQQKNNTPHDVVTNYDEDDHDDESESTDDDSSSYYSFASDGDSMLDSDDEDDDDDDEETPFNSPSGVPKKKPATIINTTKSPKQQQQQQRRTASCMIERHVQRNKKKKWTAEEAIDQLDASIHAQKQFQNRRLRLPSDKVPTFTKPVCYMTQGPLKDSVARQAVEEAVKRHHRLHNTDYSYDLSPSGAVVVGVVAKKTKLKVTSKCGCKYCANPTPFQTQAYARMRMKQNWTDDSLEGEHNDLRLPMMRNPDKRKTKKSCGDPLSSRSEHIGNSSNNNRDHPSSIFNTRLTVDTRKTLRVSVHSYISSTGEHGSQRRGRPSWS
jgi:hypothetical protein